MYNTMGEAVFYSRKELNSTKNYIVERTGRGCTVEYIVISGKNCTVGTGKNFTWEEMYGTLFGGK